jgi:Mrp family chromosome partitioning ATPase
MSNYFQTLNRLEREKSARRAAEQVRSVAADASLLAATDAPSAATDEVMLSAPVAIVETRDSRPATVPIAPPPATPAPMSEPATVAEPASPAKTQSPARAQRRIRRQSLLDATGAAGETPYLTLFDNLRLLGNGGPVKSVVLAGTVAGDWTSQVSSGLALLARRRGLRVLVADIEEGISQPLLRPRNLDVRDPLAGPGRRRGATDEARNTPSLGPIALDLRGGPIPAELSSWLQAAAGDFDLVIVEAPALARTVDAALLARACDGLILVVDSKTTTRDALRSAVDRAQAVGCRILGLVMNGTQPTLPRWASRAVGTTAQA